MSSKYIFLLVFNNELQNTADTSNNEDGHNVNNHNGWYDYHDVGYAWAPKNTIGKLNDIRLLDIYIV